MLCSIMVIEDIIMRQTVSAVLSYTLNTAFYVSDVSHDGGRVTRRALATPSLGGGCAPYSITVSLHVYCSACSKGMTCQFARLFNMCDNLYSYILKSEPSDFTLILKINTHIFYLSGMVMNEI